MFVYGRGCLHIVSLFNDPPPHSAESKHWLLGSDTVVKYIYYAYGCVCLCMVGGVCIWLYLFVSSSIHLCRTVCVCVQQGVFMYSRVCMIGVVVYDIVCVW